MTTAVTTTPAGTLPKSPAAIRARIKVLNDELNANEEEKRMMEEEVELLEKQLEESE